MLGEVAGRLGVIPLVLHRGKATDIR
jgi:hypothetical protein